MIGEMDMPVVYYVVILVGAIILAAGTFGSNIEARKSGQRDKAALQTKFDGLQTRFDDVSLQLQKVDAALAEHTKIVLQAVTAKPDDQWHSVEMDAFPAEVADYALMLFRSDRGRIIGKVRIKGSMVVAAFSTTANDRIPVVVQNAWLRESGLYRNPAVLEYAITETTDQAARLTILTAGWIDSLGREPH